MPEYAIAFHAAATVGAITTTVSALYTVAELARQLRDSGAAYLMTVPELADRALAAAVEAHVREVFVFGQAEGMTPFPRLLEGDERLLQLPVDVGEDVVALLYSSGTWGISMVNASHPSPYTGGRCVQLLRRVAELLGQVGGRA